MNSIPQSILLLSCVLLIAAGCSKKAEQAQGGFPTPQVRVIHPEKRTITDWDEFTGRFQAIEYVEIKARVGGYLDEIRYKDGQMVNKGDVLFVIDQRPFRIALSLTQAELKTAQAQHELAQKDLERVEELLKSRAVSQEEFDRRFQQRRAAQATMEAAQASVDDARLNLEFTEVKAPVSGRASRHRVDIGNLISGGSIGATLLTTIVTIDPIHFYFEASESELLKYSRMNLSGQRSASRYAPNPVWVKLLDEDDFIHEGKMDFVDNVVDEKSGTIQGRAVFENKDELIEPGMFGRARLLASGEYEALLVPDHVIGTDQSRKFVYVVNDESAVEMKYVTLGALQDDEMRVISEGLLETDNVIIGGAQRVRSGSQVQITGDDGKPQGSETVSGAE